MEDVSQRPSMLRRHRWSVAAAVLALGNILAVLANASNDETLGIDFGVFHAGGSLIDSAGFDRAYEASSFSAFFTAEYFPSLADSATVSHFISTPVFGWFAQGLTVLPFDSAFGVWLVVGALALVPACRLLELPSWAPVALLISPMMALNTSLGQTGAFVLMLFALLHVSMVDERVTRSGVLGGLLILKPPLAFGYGLLWLVRAKRYGSAMVAAAATGAVLAIPTVVGGLGPWEGFLDAMVHRADLESSWSQQSASIPEFLKLAFPLAPAWATMLEWVIGLVGALWLVVAAHRRFGDDPELLSAAAVVATVVASPHLLVYDSMILVIPVAVAFRRGLLTSDRVGHLAVITTASLVLGPPLYDVQYEQFGRGVGLEFPALVLCVWLLVTWFDGEAWKASVPVLPDSGAVDGERENLVISE